MAAKLRAHEIIVYTEGVTRPICLPSRPPRLVRRGALRLLLLCFTAFALSFAVAPARAQEPTPPKPASAFLAALDPNAGAPDVAEPPAAPDSPRASVQEFLSLCRDNKHAEAARYLDLPDPRSQEGPVLARRLKAILDRRAWVDIDLLSPSPLGDTADKLPAGVDEIAKIPITGGKTEPARIVRRFTPEGIRWIFTRTTVDRINTWYSQLPDRWFLDNLPEILLRPGPKELLLWQWLALPLLVAAAWLLSRVLAWVSRAIFSRVTAKTPGTWDDELLENLRTPLVAAWTLAALYAALPWLGLYEPADVFLTKALKAGSFLVLFWAILRFIELGGRYLLKVGRERELQSSNSLVPVLSSIGKVLVFSMGFIAVLSELGYPVASLIAGLGIGGIAIALAAQKTVENLFGSISIGLDRPFGLGDFIKIDDLTGTIERIGLRSTRIRTPDRTIVTIPNGRLADMRIESFTARDRMRLACVVSISHGATSAQLREIRGGMEELLLEHPKLWRQDLTVRFRSLGPVSLEIEVSAWFETTAGAEFMEIREEMLLGFLEIVERAGATLSTPGPTVHINAPSPQASGAQRG